MFAVADQAKTVVGHDGTLLNCEFQYCIILLTVADDLLLCECHIS